MLSQGIYSIVLLSSRTFLMTLPGMATSMREEFSWFASLPLSWV